MKNHSSESDDIITEINITPFVDVVLVLLIIFMIAAPVVYQSAVRLQLPKVVNADQMDRVTLRFYLLEDGRLTLEKNPIPVDQIADKVAQALKQDPAADAVVAADARVAHGTMMEIIDQVKSAGIRQIAISVDLKNPPKKK